MHSSKLCMLIPEMPTLFPKEVSETPCLFVSPAVFLCLCVLSSSLRQRQRLSPSYFRPDRGPKPSPRGAILRRKFGGRDVFLSCRRAGLGGFGCQAPVPPGPCRESGLQPRFLGLSPHSKSTGPLHFPARVPEAQA